MTMIVLSLMFGGCIPLAGDIQNVGNETIKLSALVDDLQAAVAESQLVESEAQEKINEEIDKVQTTLVEVATAVKDADYVDGETFGNAITGLQAANTASAPVNPYSPLIQVALGLVAAVGGGYGVKKRGDANKEATKRQADKQGRELTLRELAAMGDNVPPAVVKELMYKNIGNARAHNGIT